MSKPEDYPWSGLGYLVQTGNRHNLLGLNLGMHEWNGFKPSEIIRKYRKFVYETGAVGGRSQETEVRRQRSEVRSQESGVPSKTPQSGPRFYGAGRREGKEALT